MQQRKIAVLTCEKRPHLPRSEEPILAELASRGILGECLVWDRTDINWSQYDAVLPKTCWDYYLKIKEFDAFLLELDRLQIPTINSTEILRWNAHKSYLLDLAAKGITTAPFTLIAQNEINQFDEFLADCEDTDIILKPAVAAGSYLTQRFRLSQEDPRPHAQRVSQVSDLILQPYFPEISQQGEYSLLFFDGVLSHGILKTPAIGEFRSQPQFGSTVRRIEKTHMIVSQAQAALQKLKMPISYARVDGFLRDQKFYLMELELIEPYLFFDDAPSTAISRFVEAIDRQVPLAKTPRA